MSPKSWIAALRSAALGAASCATAFGRIRETSWPFSAPRAAADTLAEPSASR